MSFICFDLWSWANHCFHETRKRWLLLVLFTCFNLGSGVFSFTQAYWLTDGEISPKANSCTFKRGNRCKGVTIIDVHYSLLWWLLPNADSLLTPWSITVSIFLWSFIQPFFLFIYIKYLHTKRNILLYILILIFICIFTLNDGTFFFNAFYTLSWRPNHVGTYRFTPTVYAHGELSKEN